MELELLRYSSAEKSTLGLLYERLSGAGPDPQRQFLCYTLEDEARTRKVYGHTRIPAGRYEVVLRTIGNFAKKYRARFATHSHPGMLWLRNVPNFEFVLVHVGNTDDDSAGCILVGDGVEQNVTAAGGLRASTAAYARAVIPLLKRIQEGESCSITIVDYDGHVSGVAVDR